MLLVFRTDLQLDHDPGHGWKIKVRTKPLSDSAVGKILSQLLGTYLKPRTTPLAQVLGQVASRPPPDR